MGLFTKQDFLPPTSHCAHRIMHSHMAMQQQIDSFERGILNHMKLIQRQRDSADKYVQSSKDAKKAYNALVEAAEEEAAKGNEAIEDATSQVHEISG